MLAEPTTSLQGSKSTTKTGESQNHLQVGTIVTTLFTTSGINMCGTQFIGKEKSSDGPAKRKRS